MGFYSSRIIRCAIFYLKGCVKSYYLLYSYYNNCIIIKVMRLNHKGQSVLEYTLLAAIIFVGIVAGGPYLQRMVQGFFKIQDDNVQESALEVITQAGAPTTTQACTCDYGSNVSTWPSTGCSLGPCGNFQRYHYRTCTPMHCEKEYSCLADYNCCNNVTPVSCGGYLYNPFSPPNCITRNPVSSHFPSSFRGTCITPTGNDCDFGERLYTVSCGNPTKGVNGSDTFYACKADIETQQNCFPYCYGTIFKNSTDCNYSGGVQIEASDILDLGQRSTLVTEVINRKITPDRTLVLDNLTTNISQYNSYQVYNYYAFSDECAVNRYCERLCPEGFTPNPARSSCVPLQCWYGWWGSYIPNGTRNPADSDCSQLPSRKQKICPSSPSVCGFWLLCSTASSYYWFSPNPGYSVVVTASCPTGYSAVTDAWGRTFCYNIPPFSSGSDLNPFLGTSFSCNGGRLYYAITPCNI